MKSKAIKQSSQIKSTRHFWWLFLLPVTAAFTIGFVWPFIQGIYLSFCKFKTISSAKFIGLSNYASAFADESFQHSFWYTALTAIVCLVLINVIAFAVAYALTQGIKGSNIFRTIFFAPNLIGGIVLGYIWSMIFDGILQQYGTSVVLETKYGFWGLIILMCWQQIGYMMIIYIAGIQAVPEDMIEAAKIDGATKAQTLFKVIIPNVMPSITILRPEPRAYWRPAVRAARRRQDHQHDRDDGPEHLQHVLLGYRRVARRRPGEGSHILRPCRCHGTRAALVHP